jgi:hypothetical protein
VAYSSPVSRWLGKKVVKDVRFDLRFDDPAADKQFSITGDRDRLEALHTVVTNYIQQLLTLSPESFAALGQEAPSTTSVPLAPPTNDEDDVESDVWQMPINEPPTTPKAEEAIGDTTAQSKSAAAKSEYMFQTASGIKAAVAQEEFLAIKPASGLSHNLFLGSLATAETGKFIRLSVLQLFDLATALDQYASDLIVLQTYPSKTQTSSAPLAWANIAAVLLLGVGVTAVGLQVFNRPNSPQIANNRPITTNSPKVAIAPTPLPTLAPTTTILVPSPTSSIPPNRTTSAAISVPSKTPIVQTAPPGSKANPVPSNLPPQPIVVNPTAGQPTTVTIPGQSNSSSRQKPSIAVLSSSNLPPTLNPNSAKTTAAASLDSNSRESAAPEPSKPIATRTAFVNNPQVAEVSDYFNRRWEPPSSLRSSLEYSIILDVDGSIQVIEPYGLASRTYLDRTGMPLIGERFVSANQNGQSPRIRLRFNPNGKVQAFLEAGDAK